MAVVTATTKGTPKATAGEAARQALLGVPTGQSSRLPWNSGVNPSGRGGRYGTPDGYEYLNGVVATARGVAFDVRSGFQYQNRDVAEGATAWNDLKGMQVLDWFDDTKPTILGQKPWPAGGTYAAAAAGSYDTQYAAIGSTIAQKRPAGKGKVLLRWAWEWNGDWYDHGIGRHPNATVGGQFAAAWRKWYTATKSTAGESFRSVWSVAVSTSTQVELENAYPGDAYVDVIAADVYDFNCPTGQRGWHTKQQLLDVTGLGALIAFARTHGKLIAFDEWGGHATGSYQDGGDNPDFQTIMFGIFQDNADILAYECGFNETSPGNVENNLWLTNGNAVQLPNARARHIQLVQGALS